MGPIIDIHVHDCLGRAVGSPRRRLERLLALAGRAGIERLCLLGNVSRFGRDPTPHQVRTINDETMAAVRRHPDRLSGLCYLNPRHGGRFCRTEIQRCVAAGPLAGVKLWVAVRARDRRLDPILRRSAELGAFVLCHAWYKTVGGSAGESDPSDVADLARRHPGAAIVMAHVVGAGVRGVRDVAGCPNVLVDTSGSQPVDGIVDCAVARLGAERVVYGSDHPVRDFACQLGKVLGARLTRRQRELVLGGNAARLLGLRHATAAAHR